MIQQGPTNYDLKRSQAVGANGFQGGLLYDMYQKLYEQNPSLRKTPRQNAMGANGHQGALLHDMYQNLYEQNPEVKPTPRQNAIGANGHQGALLYDINSAFYNQNNPPVNVGQQLMANPNPALSGNYEEQLNSTLALNKGGNYTSFYNPNPAGVI